MEQSGFSGPELDSALDGILDDLKQDTFLFTPPATSPATKPADSNAVPRKSIRFLDVSHSISSNRSSLSEDLLPPSSSLPKPTRSILKPFKNTSIRHNSQASSPQDLHFTFAAMLASVLKQLARDDTAARVDAYHTLLNALRTHTYASDIEQLRPSIPALEGLLRRDMTMKTSGTEMLDTRVALVPLKIVILLTTDASGVVKDLSPSFLDWVAAESVEILNAPETPKEIVKNRLYLFTVDAFCARTLNAARATKLIHHLYTIHERVTGSIALSLRCAAYARVLHHHPNTMLALIGKWLPVLMRSMISNVYEIQRTAVETGIKASHALGAKQQATSTFQAYCNAQDKGQGITRFEIFQKGVSEILESGSPDARLEVPRIWGAVILFLRASSKPLNQWTHFRSWMAVLTRCFKSQNAPMIIRSFTALNRLLFALKPDQHIELSLLAEILAIIMTVLRQADSEPVLPLKIAARSSLCTLIFYAFRPSSAGSASDRFDFFWHRIVKQGLSSIAIFGAEEHTVVCQCLYSLLGRSRLAAWNEDSFTVSFKDPLRQDQLPPISNQWIRLRASQIVSVFHGLVMKCPPQTATLEKSPLILAWDAFMESIAEAGKKEITMRSEHRSALSTVLMMLSQLRCDQSESLEFAQTKSTCVLRMMNSTMKIFGPAMFLTPSLLCSAKQQPQQVLDQEAATVNSDLGGLAVSILSDVVGTCGQNCSDALKSAVKVALTFCVKTVPSRTSRSSFLLGLTRSMVSTAGAKNDKSVEWWIRSEIQSLIEDELPTEGEEANRQPEDEELYENAVAVLRASLAIHNTPLWDQRHSSLTSMLDQAKRARGRDFLRERVFNPLLEVVALWDGGCCEDARRGILIGCVDLVFDVCEMPSIESDWKDPDRQSLNNVASAMNVSLQLLIAQDTGLQSLDTDFCDTICTILTFGKYLEENSLLQSLPTVIERALEAQTNDDVDAYAVRAAEALLDALTWHFPLSDAAVDALIPMLDACLVGDVALAANTRDWCSYAITSEQRERLPPAMKQQLDSQEPVTSAPPAPKEPIARQDLPEGASVASGPDTPSSMVEPARPTVQSPPPQPAQPTQELQSDNAVQSSEESWLSKTTDEASFPSNEATLASVDRRSPSVERFISEIPSTPSSSQSRCENGNRVADYSSPIEALQRNRLEQRQLAHLLYARKTYCDEPDVPSSPPEAANSSKKIGVANQTSPLERVDNVLQIDGSNETDLEHHTPSLPPFQDSTWTGEALSVVTNAENLTQDNQGATYASSDADEEGKDSEASQQNAFEGYESPSRPSKRQKTAHEDLEGDDSSSLQPDQRSSPELNDAFPEVSAAVAEQTPLETDFTNSTRRSTRKNAQLQTPPTSSSNEPEKPAVNVQESQPQASTTEAAQAVEVPAKRPRGRPPKNKRKAPSSDQAPRPAPKRIKPTKAVVAAAPASRRSQRVSKPTAKAQKGLSKEKAKSRNENETQASPQQLLKEPVEAEEVPEPEVAEPTTPQHSFDFQSSSQMSAGSTPGSSQSSQSSYIAAFKDRFKNLLSDARKLFLGDEKRTEDRETVENLASGLTQEIKAAGSRKRKRAS